MRQSRVALGSLHPVVLSLVLIPLVSGIDAEFALASDRLSMGTRCHGTQGASNEAMEALAARQYPFHSGGSGSVPDMYRAVWDRIVKGIRSRFAESCLSYAQQSMTEAELTAEMLELDELYGQAVVFEKQLQSMPLSGPGPSATPSGTDELLDGLQVLARNIEEPDPTRGVPVKPKKPCKPPDIIGAPGRSC